MAMAFIRKVPTKSGAAAVQIIYKKYGQITYIDHIGSAHNPWELDTLVALAKQREPNSHCSLTIVIRALAVGWNIEAKNWHKYKTVCENNSA